MLSNSDILKHLIRETNGGEPAGFQDHRAMRNASSLSLIMGDDHAGHPALPNDIEDEVLNLSC
jgi:hypothetical protein